MSEIEIHRDFYKALKLLIEEIVDTRLKESVPKSTILSVWAAMDRYNITRSTIYKWFGDGVIRKHMIGGRVFVYIEDFERQKSREEILRAGKK